MPWTKTAADRERDAQVYGPEYRRNREAARRRAGGTCEQCHHQHARLECDHIRNIAGGQPDHSLGNLQMLCKGPRSCRCHEDKTAAESGGWRKKPDPQPVQRTNW